MQELGWEDQAVTLDRLTDETCKIDDFKIGFSINKPLFCYMFHLKYSKQASFKLSSYF